MPIWLRPACLAALLSLPAISGALDVSVTDHGAKPDGITLATAAIQGAIDTCHEAGGGRVTVPAGRFLVTELVLKSGVDFHLSQGAVLVTSGDPSDYKAEKNEGPAPGVSGDTGLARSPEHPRVLFAKDAERISLTGGGRIQGTGQEDLNRRPGEPKKPLPKFRPGAVRFEDCRQVVIRDIELREIDWHTIHLVRCEDVLVDNVRILNNFYRVNTDGINPISSRRVRISNCHIVAGDDGICLKTEAKDPCEDIVITNCLISSNGSAVKLGTGSSGDFRNVVVSNLVIRDSETGIGIFAKDGGTVENVLFSGIVMDLNERVCAGGGAFAFPIFVDIERRHADSPLSTVRNVTFSDMIIRTSGGLLLQGMPESTLQDIRLSDLALFVRDPVDFQKRHKRIGGHRTTKDERDRLFARQESYLTIAHCRGLLVEDVMVILPDTEDEAARNRAALGLFHVEADAVSDLLQRRGTEIVPGEIVREARPLESANP